MTNQHHPCATPHCATPATAVICQGCTTDVVTALRQLACGPQQRTRVHVVDHRTDPPTTKTFVDYLPGLVADLDDAISRQTSTTDGIGILVRQAETALPYHEAASILAAELRNTITTWARLLLDDHPHLELADPSTAGVAGWLSRLPALLAMLPAAGEMVDEITHATKRVRSMVDRAPDKVFVGPCGAEATNDADEVVVCVQDLYGTPTKEQVRCPTCGVTWDMAERREWLLRVVYDQLATTQEIVRAMPNLLGEGFRVASGTIRSWVTRGKLNQHDPHPHDERERPRYRIGDVIDLVVKASGKEGSAA